MYHEDRSKISNLTQDMNRAIDSLREEFEAVDWYGQRAEACTDENLKKILVHNMNEEKEHAMMLLEWIRQHDPKLNEELDHYVGKGVPDITAIE
jgi:hypothetical protein